MPTAFGTEILAISILLTETLMRVKYKSFLGLQPHPHFTGFAAVYTPGDPTTGILVTEKLGFVDLGSHLSVDGRIDWRCSKPCSINKERTQQRRPRPFLSQLF